MTHDEMNAINREGASYVNVPPRAEDSCPLALACLGLVKRPGESDEGYRSRMEDQAAEDRQYGMGTLNNSPMLVVDLPVSSSLGQPAPGVEGGERPIAEFVPVGQYETAKATRDMARIREAVEGLKGATLDEVKGFLKSGDFVLPDVSTCGAVVPDRNGITSAFADVLAFHRKFNQVIGTTPAVPPEGRGTLALRLSMIDEEFDELDTALASGDLPGIADAACDLIYVVLGTLVSYGIDPGPVWAAIHGANMSKSHDKTILGKVVKGPNFKHPDVAAILAGQRSLLGMEGGQS